MVNAVDDREELYEKIKKAKEDIDNANDELAEEREIDGRQFLAGEHRDFTTETEFHVTYIGRHF